MIIPGRGLSVVPMYLAAINADRLALHLLIGLKKGNCARSCHLCCCRKKKQEDVVIEMLTTPPPLGRWRYNYDVDINGSSKPPRILLILASVRGTAGASPTQQIWRIATSDKPQFVTYDENSALQQRCGLPCMFRNLCSRKPPCSEYLLNE